MSDKEREYRSKRRRYESDDDDVDIVPGGADNKEDGGHHTPQRSSGRYRDRRRSREMSADRKERKGDEGISDRHRDRRDRERRRSRDRERDRDPRRSKSPRSGSRDRSRDDRRKEKDRRRHRHRDRERPEEGKEVAPVRQRAPLPPQADSFARTAALEAGQPPPQEKEKPNFKNTGFLAALSNQVTQSDGTTVVLKYHEPPEARKPSSKDVWKLFVFKGKGEDVIDTVDLNGRSCWLVGRELSVADLPTQHPSVSKQHAVVQFRYVEKRDEYGERKGKVKPFVIDLESTHGTFLNGERIEERRYVEIRNKDVVRFGKSEREYVFMLDRD